MPVARCRTEVVAPSPPLPLPPTSPSLGRISKMILLYGFECIMSTSYNNGADEIVK